jgi:O-antigen/teichoic acid export membrane protein
VNKKNLVKNIITTLGGTSVAILVSFLSTPILSRIYTPEDFGDLAIFLSFISIGAIVATWRYEIAIVIPKRELYATYLTIASLLLAIINSSIICIFNLIIWLARPEFVSNFMSPVVFILLFPIGLFILSAIQTLTCWQIRQQDYKTIAKARVLQSLSSSTLQITFGLINSYGGLVLIIGYILGAATSLICIVRSNINYFLNEIKALRLIKLRVLMTRFSNMPKYMVVGHLANILSSQMPIILFALIYGQKYAGFYGMAERLVVLPVAIISSSVGEVFRSASAIEYQNSRNCLSLFLKTKARLAILGITTAIPIYILAPYAFPFVLGDAWIKSGEVAVLLSALIFFQTISSPLSQVVYLASMYRLDLAWQIFRLSGAIIAIYTGYWVYDDFLISVRLYVLTLCVAYIVHSYMQFIAASGWSSFKYKSDKKINKLMRND